MQAKSTGGAAMDQMLMLRIRERAYEIWAATGGDAEKNWLRAEAELLNDCNCDPVSSLKKKKKRRTATRAVPSGSDR